MHRCLAVAAIPVAGDMAPSVVHPPPPIMREDGHQPPAEGVRSLVPSQSTLSAASLRRTLGDCLAEHTAAGGHMTGAKGLRGSHDGGQRAAGVT